MARRGVLVVAFNARHIACSARRAGWMVHAATTFPDDDLTVLGRGNAMALDRGRWQGLYLDARAYTIGGGTSEVMRNIIAEKALQLPKGR